MSKPARSGQGALPTGTVTFLLTDVEGSVRRWEAEPDAMAGDTEVLDQALTAEISRHGGVRPMEQGEGDSALAAFPRASDAVSCALAIQRRLASEVPEIHLRLALHTSDAQTHERGGYVSQAINRCARLRDLAHGGQVLLSRTTADLVLDRLPDDASLTHLGSFRLRDLTRPEDVFQLLHPDLRVDFPPLRSLDAVPNNLPTQLTTFVGREKEIAEIRSLLSRSRMVTLTGSGGAGKTRLALQVSGRATDSYPDGIWWVDLAPVADPELVPSAVAAALAIREAPTRPLIESILQELRERTSLLVLDNCEHLVEASASLAATVLRSCSRVSILATSRHTLDVEGETAYRVPSLDLPDDGSTVDALTRYEAVQLFVDRASRARPNFRLTSENAAAVSRICSRLDGLPLAIELAAARVRVLSPERIESELNDVFHVLTRGARTAVPRHRTLQASVAWSYELLGEDERATLRRLSVFAGGFTLDAAEAVVADGAIERARVLDLLSGLVDKSLVHVDETHGRFRLLETIRQYAGGRLREAGEDADARTRHLEFFTELAEREHPEVEGPRMVEAVRLLTADHDNLRAAVEWGAASGRDETALRLAAGLRTFWFAAGHWREARARYETLLAREIPDRGVVARGYVGAATNCLQLSDWTDARRFAEKGLAAAREVGDAMTAARAGSLIGTATMWMGDFEGARPHWEQGIAEATAIGDDFTVAQAYWALASGEWLNEGDLPRAGAAFEESLAAARRTGNPLRIGMALTNLGNMTGWRDPRASEQLLVEAVRHLEEVGEPAFRAIALGGLSWARLLQGDEASAREHAERAVRLASEAGSPAGLAQARFALGSIHRARGDLDAAAVELESSATLGGVVLRWAAFLLTVLARVHLERGDALRAEESLRLAEGILPEPKGVFRGLLADARAWLARAEGEIERSEALAHEALSSVAEADMGPWIVDLLEFLGWSAGAHESHLEATRLFAAAHAARGSIGYVHFPSTRERFEADVAVSRAGLDEEAFARAWNEGAAMSLDEAVAYARRGRGERKRPSVGWASLTPTELDVARLVAERLTNPQIAERLFVSRGTVKAHLSHIYTKLGISSRMELADEVARHLAERPTG